MIKQKKAFALIDSILAIALIGLAFVVFSYTQKAQKITQTHINEQRFLQSFDTGLIKSFDEIIDTYQSALIPTADTDTKWGWNKMNTVSPFPSYVIKSGVPYLAFDLSNATIGATKLQKLQRSIISNFRGACRDATAKAGGGNILYLYCEDLQGLQYQTSTGTAARPVALGNPIDPSDVPVAVVTFAKRNGAGAVGGTDTYMVSYSSAYLKRQVESANRIGEMRAALESFTNATKLKEIANIENTDKSGGLNNADDEFVGWHWKLFGDNMGLIQSTYCNKPVGGGICTNLNTANIWRSGTNIARGLISRRFVNNLMSGDTSYYMDAFGNGIYIYPTALQCTGTDFMACAINALTIPQDNYITIGNPPYTTVIYTEPFKNKATAGQPYGRAFVTY